MADRSPAQGQRSAACRAKSAKEITKISGYPTVHPPPPPKKTIKSFFFWMVFWKPPKKTCLKSVCWPIFCLLCFCWMVFGLYIYILVCVLVWMNFVVIYFSIFVVFLFSKGCFWSSQNYQNLFPLWMKSKGLFKLFLVLLVGSDANMLEKKHRPFWDVLGDSFRLTSLDAVCERILPEISSSFFNHIISNEKPC